MHFKLEVPEDTLLVSRSDLKEALRELLEETKNNSPEEEIMTISDAAAYLKVSIPTVRNLISRKEIPFFQRGQVIRLNRMDLKEWMKTNSRKG
ncbi:helix-turn-helix domain-containing protein [Fictibacillus sp. S7]|uniref:helix-turn-helix domain-containing protein n=1 Tax=Fictibacillus sp. S7 TaxID=2212476 RepID=UPI001011B3F4|nr:helix-turn-helix domain-containing protein [Fictibacillus sp. S7]RXZ00950.1 DNA-binding protein [Fictibacillus sp. S7]